MSKIKRSLTVTEALRLVNDLIDGTEIQNMLIQWKIKHRIFYNDIKDLGTVGKNWWLKFLKRNKHLLRSKSGKKYAFDRALFSTYLNFCDMYDHIEDILVFDSNIATKFTEPIWVNKQGERVLREEDSFGCKVSIDIKRPDMCIVMDEVGCNLSQENDNANGGQKFMCGKDEEPYQTISTKHQHFTCLGLTRLDGEALMCVVIISGKRQDALVESGIEWNELNNIENIDSMEDLDELQFFISNFGKNNLFPGGPTCNYKGIEVPAYITFSESGGISATILTNIFRRLDDLKIYDEDRRQGRIPFVLLDGHQSRFDVNFLCYINDDNHRWNVTLGVPYGTALWQVGDSSEQNGKFKMLLGEAKKELYGKRLAMFLQGLQLIRYDILPLVNRCWPPAFADVANNCNAIVERGWYPFCRNLLLNYLLRATMTQEMLNWEKECGFFGKQLLTKLHNVEYSERNGKVTLVCKSENSYDKVDLNFNEGVTAQYVATTILTESDRQVARQQSQRMKEEGTTLKERLNKITRVLTAGKMTIEARNYGLSKTIRDHALDIDKSKKDGELAKKRRADLNYMKLCYRADKAREKNGIDSDIMKWKSKADMLAHLKPLKNKSDTTLPSNRDEIESLLVLWKYRERKPTSCDNEVLHSFHQWVDDENNKNRGKPKKRKRNDETSNGD